jgi:hypothetical protein
MLYSTLFRAVLLFSGLCYGNVEKTIFLPKETSSISYNGEFTLSPESPVISISLNTAFVSADQPKGLQHWGLLKGLEVGRRYEVRVCWAATVTGPLSHSHTTQLTLPQSPADFNFNLYTPKEIVSVPNHPTHNLISETVHTSNVDPTKADLILELSVVASYFTSNKTRMATPDPVHVQLSKSYQSELSPRIFMTDNA